MQVIKRCILPKPRRKGKVESNMIVGKQQPLLVRSHFMLPQKRSSGAQPCTLENGIKIVTSE